MHKFIKLLHFVEKFTPILRKSKMTQVVKPLRERLSSKEFILVAEGHTFELERRGYLKAGSSVPDVILKHPDIIEQLYLEFVHAGSDAVVALAAHTDSEKEMEKVNRAALQLAKKAAVETDSLMAGTIQHSTIYDPNDSKTGDLVCCLFKESIEWAVQEGADYIIGESFLDLGEALLAAECIKEYGAGLPSVIIFAQLPDSKTRDGYTYGRACKELEDAGADIVGLNCLCLGLGVWTKLISEIRKSCRGHIAALAAPYPTDYRSLVIPEEVEVSVSSSDYCPEDEIVRFGEVCRQIGVKYVGLSHGNNGRYFRHLAEPMGKRPMSSGYSDYLHAVDVQL